MPLLANVAVIEDHYEANCTGAEEVGDLVYTHGPGPEVRKADPDNLAAMPAVGIVVQRIGPATCIVQVSGEVELAGVVAGEVYFVGLDGKPTSTRPPRPSSGKRSIQFVGFGRDDDLLDLRPSSLPTRILQP